MAQDRQEVGRKKLEQDARKLRALFPQWVYLDTPLTAGAWNGDPYSTTAKTVIDLSAVFGVPAGVRAILISVEIRDSDSTGTNTLFYLAPNNTADQGIRTRCYGRADNTYETNCFVCPCDANGDVYYQSVASGAGTMDVILEIWGYAI